MAEFLKKLKAFAGTPAGTVVAVLIYAAMLVLVLIFFTGEGEFIYEGF